jgi:hypothetical protein
MKFFGAFILMIFSLPLFSQHYYKDIVGTRETAQMMKAYQQNKVRGVQIYSFDEKGGKIEDFSVRQLFDGKMLRTITQSGMNQQSELISFTDEAGRVVKTIDSNRLMHTQTDYTYTPEGQLLSIISLSADSARSSVQREEHIWQYKNNTPVRMLRIKNGRDTAFVHFKLDEQGNVIEEQEIRKGIRSEPVYYYYNDNNQLTDVVQYNRKARKLLPQYLMEYAPAGQVIQRITVPTGSDNYLIWRYQYNQQGLKTKEVVYNKQKQMTGKVEYQYSFGQ